MRHSLPLGFLTLMLGSLVAPALAQRPPAPPVEIVPDFGHSSAIWSVAFSPDRRFLVSGSPWDKVRLWDAAGGRLIRTFSEPSRHVSFSPDGRYVLGCHGKTVSLWDAASGALVRTFDGHTGDVWSATFSPDGARVLTGSQDKTAKLWDAATGRVLQTFGAGDTVAVAFSPDGHRVLSAANSDDTLKLWDAGNGSLLRTFGRLSRPVRSVAFSPDGTRILSGDQKSITLWDAASGRVLRSFEEPLDHITMVRFSPDGARVLTGSRYDKALKLWDVATGRILQSFEGHLDGVDAAAFSRDGARVLSSSNRALRLWDAQSGRLLRAIEGQDVEVSSVAFSPDGARVLSGNRDKTLKLWDASVGRLLRTFEGHSDMVLSVAFSPDGRRAVSGSSDRTVRLWDATSGLLLLTFEGHADRVNSVAFSHDGRHVLSGSDDKTIKLWDAVSGRLLRTFEGHLDVVSSVAFSPDGSHVLSGSGNYSFVEKTAVKLWNVTTGQIVRTFDGGPLRGVSAVAFSPEGTRVLTVDEGEVKLWDSNTGQLLRTLESSHLAFSVALPRDGSRVLTGGPDALQLWDAATGQLLRTFAGNSGGNAVAFSPDGRRLVSGGATIQIWSHETGGLLISLLSTRTGEWLAITPEGFFDASEKGADALSAVRGLEVLSFNQFYQSLYRPDLVREKLAGDPRRLVREAAAKLDLDKVLASGNAPLVTLVSPRAGTRASAEQVTAEVEISDTGGGIGRVEWRVNGVTLGVEARGLKRVDGPAATAAAGKLVVRQALALDPGDNVIEVVAYNAQGLIASLPASVKVTREAAAPSAAVRLHVLAIGVNDYYDGRLRLNYAVPDAKALGAAFSKAGATVYQQVHVTTVLDAEVTRAKLDAVFNELAGKMRPSDVFVFFIAGHGKTVDGRYYFIPQDFRYESERSIVEKGIDQEQWQAWFARIAAKKSVLLFDTCESGSLTGEQVALRGLEHVAALERMTRAMGRTILSASTDDAPALEGYRGHGLFTFTLLEAIERADADGNGLIEVTELAQYVDAQVPELSLRQFRRRQVPQMRIVGSNYALAKPTAVLAGGSSQLEVPRRPTHVVVTATEVVSSPAPGAARVQSITPGTLVTLVRTEAGWTLIARDGKPLGFVATKDLLPIQ